MREVNGTRVAEDWALKAACIARPSLWASLFGGWALAEIFLRIRNLTKLRGGHLFKLGVSLEFYCIYFFRSPSWGNAIYASINGGK